MRYQNGEQFAADLRAALAEVAAPLNPASNAHSTVDHGNPTPETNHFDTTVVQPSQGYEVTQKVPSDAPNFDQTVVNDSRGTSTKT